MSWISTPDSSNMAGFEYVEGTGVLIIEFRNGSRYSYYDVPSAVFEQMKSAPSKGQFLAQNVKGIYRYART
jgi:hypothetical protein